MPKTFAVVSLTPADLLGATYTRGHADGTVTIYYEGEVPPPLPVEPPALPAVSRRQLKQALSKIGLRKLVEDAVAAGNQDLKDWYHESGEFERNHPQVLAMGTALGQSPEALDNLWKLAATL